MNTNQRSRQAGRGQPAGADRWLAPLGRHPWYLASAAIAVIALIVGGAALLIEASSAPSQPAASGCGLINCGASVPSPGISTQSHISKAHAPVSHPPAIPRQSASPTPGTPSQAPVTTPAPAPPPAPNVSVSLTANRDRRDFDHFQDQLTLVNNGGSPVSGWTLQLALPGDGIDSVETQFGRDGSQFDHWQFREDTLTISADTDSETLRPGDQLNVTISGRGNTASPTGCTFNGAACPAGTLEHQAPQQSQPSGQPGQPTPDQQLSAGQLSPQDQPTQQDRQPAQQDNRSWQQDRQSSWQDQRSWQGGYRRF
jgi:hypothetical protein